MMMMMMMMIHQLCDTESKQLQLTANMCT